MIVRVYSVAVDGAFVQIKSVSLPVSLVTGARSTYVAAATAKAVARMFGQ